MLAAGTTQLSVAVVVSSPPQSSPSRPRVQPFIAVQALADSPAGKQLSTDLQARIPELRRQAVDRDAQRAAARALSPYYGPGRPLWLGPLSRQPPAWLDGTLPGDYGWDPLSLGQDPAKLERYVELELLHARCVDPTLRPAPKKS